MERCFSWMITYVLLFNGMDMIVKIPVSSVKTPVLLF